MRVSSFITLGLLLSVAGCTSEPNPLASTGPLEDLARLPQDAAAFVPAEGIPEFGSSERRRKILTEY